MFEKTNSKDTMLLEEIVRLLRRQNDSLDRLNNMLEEIALNNDWLNDDDDDGLNDWDDDEDLKALKAEILEEMNNPSGFKAESETE